MSTGCAQEVPPWTTSVQLCRGRLLSAIEGLHDVVGEITCIRFEVIQLLRGITYHFRGQHHVVGRINPGNFGLFRKLEGKIMSLEG